MLVFSGNANLALAKKICKHLGIRLGKALVGRFSDGEVRVKIEENVRGKDVFLIQPTSPPVNENLMELLIILDALKRASPKRITAVIPYFGYARQDRKDQPRVPITAKLVANLLTVAGANRILTLDLHAGQVQGFFDIPLDHLYAVNVFLDYFKKVKLDNNLVVVSPDVGGIKMARAYAKRFRASLAIVDKRRNSPESTEVMHILGEVKGKNAILVDDIIATGSSLVEAAKALKIAKAKRIYACVTHGVLSANVIQKLEDSFIDFLVITDSIPLPKEKQSKKIKVVSVSKLFAEAIKRIHQEKSISILFDSIRS
ncbi:MAG: phosphoribosylpyrophosphate synthetase [Candidatus Omnitrophota bacterium]|nr:MAG: phosphoribosylpyrophosphate synthetase [Candidatus Omnitrophota bacterium]RKY44752.1 MAG: phosphoribosylpyrophosphate synthetase [Candidatus Omnitrophota bacterium]HDN86449.1 ribose-phosphate pyrophosphokinase [Candidatus Omnitrophota bacterium]